MGGFYSIYSLPETDEVFQPRPIDFCWFFCVGDNEVQLKKVNEKLWKIEDKIREKEKLQEFDDEFIELARSVYITNDERSKIKKKINELTNSSFREVKVY